MDDQQRDGMSDTPQAWDSVRRVREPIAWALLAFTAITVLVSACQLFNLAGAKVPIPIPVPGPGGAMTVSAFALRASAVAPQFLAAIVTAPPVLSVVLVAFSGDLTEHARQVVQTAAVVQAVTFVVALISLAGAAGSHTRPGTWFILVAAELAIAATALFFTGAVIWSQAFPSAAPRFWDAGDDDQGPESDTDFRP